MTFTVNQLSDLQHANHTLTSLINVWFSKYFRNLKFSSDSWLKPSDTGGAVLKMISASTSQVILLRNVFHSKVHNLAYNILLRWGPWCTVRVIYHFAVMRSGNLSLSDLKFHMTVWQQGVKILTPCWQALWLIHEFRSYGDSGDLPGHSF